MRAPLLAVLALLATSPSGSTTKKAKRKAGASKQDRPLRLPPSSRVDAAAYGVPERSHWTPAAALPALAARNATAWPPSPLAELNHDANAAIHRRIKRDGHLHLVRPRTASAQRLLISTPLFLRGCLHLLTERAAHPG